MQMLINFLCLFGNIKFFICDYIIQPSDLLMLNEHDIQKIDHYTNTWYFYSTEEPDQIFNEIKDQGFIALEKIEGIPNVYKLRKENHPEKNSDGNHEITKILRSHDKINWVKQGFMRYLHKRGPTSVRSRYERYFNDELWSLQWYEDEKISINLNWNTTDPMPRYCSSTINRHGTRCAGEIAMAANNNKCGVGVAYNAKVGGIVLLDGKTNDEMEAKAVNYALELVDIYNGSWGPLDNGETVDGPGVLGQLAFDIGASKGRCGKGSIYVFAAGNGRHLLDNCSADGYAGSIYSLVIACATRDGKAPFYAERCAAVIATAYSGGSQDSIQVITSDLNNTCTTTHTGTSAAAPLVSGIVALALEANGNLTWRDVQHLIVRNCEVTPLLHNDGWLKNAAGYNFNPQFGFGLINAYKLVKEAMGWINVPEKTTCAVDFLISNNENNIGRNVSFTSSVMSNGCNGCIKYLEHVQLSISINYPIRGMIEVDLISPNGTQCKMMESRPLDTSDCGFNEWKIKSLQFWGENPSGFWIVSIKDQNSNKNRDLLGSVQNLTIILHGTKAYPYNFDK
ncbi:neuroendocrine convertase 1-like isoform X2 [Daktulosphaira vitifoliae]|uniref:neuroendocrine convertase 1-like isoform X2 n=1 Tax=Daktulosphaira vitifoliae TaxID=58002 RepID=UPI0021AA6791|nr:neuroendocrine convertase 1-like isoform X2 [Daktulosphaira vitifoliae]